MPILYKFQIKSFMGLSISQQKSTNAMKMDAIFHGDKRKENILIQLSLCLYDHMRNTFFAFCKPNAESRGSRCFFY